MNDFEVSGSDLRTSSGSKNSLLPERTSAGYRNTLTHNTADTPNAAGTPSTTSPAHQEEVEFFMVAF